MCTDNNIINCLTQFGILYYTATLVGVVGLFVAPRLIWTAFTKGDGGKPRFDEDSPVRLLYFRLSAVLAALAYALAAFFVFPGVLFCSVFCFLGIGLPAIGVTTAIAFGVSIFQRPYKEPA